jgi:hypothetical protein
MDGARSGGEDAERRNAAAKVLGWRVAGSAASISEAVYFCYISPIPPPPPPPPSPLRVLPRLCFDCGGGGGNCGGWAVYILRQLVGTDFQ